MVELIPKKREVTLPRGMTVLFYASWVIFIFVLVAFGILSLLIKKAEDNLQETKATIEKERSPERIQLEAELKEYEKKIKDFSQLVASHFDTRKFFAELEKNTHPNVWFSEISLDFEKFTVKLSGKAESFTALGQQLSILEQAQFFKNVNLSDLSLSKEGEVKFSLDFSFGQELFQQ